MPGAVRYVFEHISMGFVSYSSPCSCVCVRGIERVTERGEEGGGAGNFPLNAAAGRPWVVDRVSGILALQPGQSWCVGVGPGQGGRDGGTGAARATQLSIKC